MILQRIANAVRQQSWFAVAIEFVIVVAGVVIGFQINAWNGDRMARQAELESLSALTLDLNFLLEETDQLIGGSYRKAYMMGVVFTTIQTGELAENEQFAFERGLYTLVYSRPPPQASGSLDDLLSGSAMNRISDDQLRLQLYRVQQQLDTAVRQQTFFNDLLRDYHARVDAVFTYSIPDNDLVLDYMQEPGRSVEEFLEVYRELGLSIASYDLAALQANPEIARSYAEAREVELGRINEFTMLRDEIVAALARLDELGIGAEEQR